MISREAIASMLEGASDNAQHWRDQCDEGDESWTAWNEDIRTIEVAGAMLMHAPELLAEMRRILAAADAGTLSDQLATEVRRCRALVLKASA